MTTTDPKSIDPRSLDAEERAILDMEVKRLVDLGPRGLAQRDRAYLAAMANMEPIILARRQFFAAPQPETVGTVCPACKKPVAHQLDHIPEGTLTAEFTLEHYTCQPKKETIRFYPDACPKCRFDPCMCGEPAPCPTPEAGAASEMPEAINYITKEAINASAEWARKLTESGESKPELVMAYSNHYAYGFTDGAASVSQPAKPASVMTPELENILSQVECTALHFCGLRGIMEGVGRQLLSDLSAVRAQASQPVEAKRVRLPATVDALKDALSGWKAILSQGAARELYGIGWDRVIEKIEAAYAELKREGIEG